MIIETVVIIVNWDGERWLKNCLDSLETQTYKKFKIFFVDNGSNDGSVLFVKANYKHVRVIELDKNYGFAKGNNIGIKLALKIDTVKYIACINNDTIVDKGWLNYLIKRVSSSPKLGAVSSKMVFPNGIINSIGVFVNKFGYGYSLGIGQKDSKDFLKPRQIWGFCGGSFVIKTSILQKIGLFEELFESYYEDADLSLRLKNKGYLIFYEPKSKVIHYHSGTLGSFSERKFFLTERNRLIYLAKNHTPLVFLINLILSPFLLFFMKRKRKYFNSDKVKLNYCKLLRTYIHAIFEGTIISLKIIIGRLF